jgi:hypothetical protein
MSEPFFDDINPFLRTISVLYGDNERLRADLEEATTEADDLSSNMADADAEIAELKSLVKTMEARSGDLTDLTDDIEILAAERDDIAGERTTLQVKFDYSNMHVQRLQRVVEMLETGILNLADEFKIPSARLQFMLDAITGDHPFGEPVYPGNVAGGFLHVAGDDEFWEEGCGICPEAFADAKPLNVSFTTGIGRK